MSQSITKARRMHAFLALLGWMVLFTLLSLLSDQLPFWAAAFVGPALFVAGLIGMRRLFQGYESIFWCFGYLSYIAAKTNLYCYRDVADLSPWIRFLLPALWFFPGLIVGDWIRNEDSLINRIRQRGRKTNLPPTDEAGVGGSGSGTV